MIIPPKNEHLAFIRSVGRKAMQERLGITSAQGIFNRVADGNFPASWFMVLSDLAREVGVECPTSLFAFKPLSIIGGGAPDDVQGRCAVTALKDSEQSENTQISDTSGESSPSVRLAES